MASRKIMTVCDNVKNKEDYNCMMEEIIRKSPPKRFRETFSRHFLAHFEQNMSNYCLYLYIEVITVNQLPDMRL